MRYRAIVTPKLSGLRPDENPLDWAEHALDDIENFGRSDILQKLLMRRQRLLSPAPSQHQMLWTHLWIFGDQPLQRRLHVSKQNVRQAAIGNDITVACESNRVCRF